MRRFRVAHDLKASLWTLPLLCILAGFAVSIITTSVDDGDLIPRSVSDDPQAALQILYLIAFAMLTLTGLVLSLLVVACSWRWGRSPPGSSGRSCRTAPARCRSRSSPGRSLHSGRHHDEGSATAVGLTDADRATATTPDRAGIGSAVELAGPEEAEQRLR